MKTSTIVVLGVVGVAVVGGIVYFVVRQKKAPAKQPSSTTDKIAGTVAAAIPIATEIVKLWNK